MYINRIGGAGGKNLVALRAAMKALGPSLLLDADLVSGNDGDAIQTWSDDSGYGNNFSQAYSGYRPLLKKAANGINGHNVLRFDGIDDVMAGPAASSVISVSADTVWIVFRILAITTNETGSMLYANDTALCGGYCWGVIFLTSLGAVIFLNSDGIPYERVSAAISTSTPYISRSRHSSGNLYLRINAGSEGSVSAGDIYRVAENLRLAADYSGSIFTQIDIAEVIIFNSALSAGNMATVDAYLKAKYATY